MYSAAQSRFAAHRDDPTAAWQFGRAAYDLAYLSADNDQRARIAEDGADACRHAITTSPETAPAYYYLALNLGEIARVRKLGALRMLHEMEHALLEASKLDPKFDYAGPDRSVGILYRQAPSWPLSIGNRNKARAHLEAAVRISPDYPDNRISLAEAYADWSEVKSLESELNALEKLLPQARTCFDPVTWQSDWKDWEKRLGDLRQARDRLLSNPRISPTERGARAPKAGRSPSD